MLHPQKERCCTLRRRDAATSEEEMNKCLEAVTSNLKSVEKNEKEEKNMNSILKKL